MRQKLIGAGIAAVLVSLAAVGAFASQDGVNLLSSASGVSNIAAVETPTETPTDAAGTDTSTPTETPTDIAGADTSTPTPTETAGAETSTPTATETAGAATSTPTAASTSVPASACDATPDTTTTATATAAATSTLAASTSDDGDDQNENDAEDCDIKGIPDSNPVMHPEDGDGECDKHETIIKTTPSGNQVTVPCQTQEHGNGGQGNGHGHGAGGN